MASINPGMVLGPRLALTGGESQRFALWMVGGWFRAGLFRTWTAFADVEDVAAAHILAALNPASDDQRYLCAAGTTSFDALVAGAEAAAGGGRWWSGPGVGRFLMWFICNMLRVVPWDAMWGSVDRPYTVDNSKIKRELGIQFIEPARSLADMGIKMEKLLAAGATQKKKDV